MRTISDDLESERVEHERRNAEQSRTDAKVSERAVQHLRKLRKAGRKLPGKFTMTIFGVR
jgi:hypothetical protein